MQMLCFCSKNWYMTWSCRIEPDHRSQFPYICHLSHVGITSSLNVTVSPLCAVPMLTLSLHTPTVCLANMCLWIFLLNSGIYSLMEHTRASNSGWVAVCHQFSPNHPSSWLCPPPPSPACMHAYWPGVACQAADARVPRARPQGWEGPRPGGAHSSRIASY